MLHKFKWITTPSVHQKMPLTKEVVKFIKNNNCFNITSKFDWHPIPGWKYLSRVLHLAFDSYFFNLTLENDCFELCFWTVAFKTTKLSFEPRLCMFLINVYYTKSKGLQSLNSLLVIKMAHKCYLPSRQMNVKGL